MSAIQKKLAIVVKTHVKIVTVIFLRNIYNFTILFQVLLQNNAQRAMQENII